MMLLLYWPLGLLTKTLPVGVFEPLYVSDRLLLYVQPQGAALLSKYAQRTFPFLRAKSDGRANVF